jgi:hypothetical protein
MICGGDVVSGAARKAPVRTEPHPTCTLRGRKFRKESVGSNRSRFPLSFSIGPQSKIDDDNEHENDG